MLKALRANTIGRTMKTKEPKIRLVLVTVCSTHQYELLVVRKEQRTPTRPFFLTPLKHRKASIVALVDAAIVTAT